MQMTELERRVVLTPGKPVLIEILLDGTMGVVYVKQYGSDELQAYNLATGSWGLFASQGNAVFSQIKLATL